MCSKEDKEILVLGEAQRNLFEGKIVGHTPKSLTNVPHRLKVYKHGQHPIGMRHFRGKAQKQNHKG